MKRLLILLGLIYMGSWVGVKGQVKVELYLINTISGEDISGTIAIPDTVNESGVKKVLWRRMGIRKGSVKSFISLNKYSDIKNVRIPGYEIKSIKPDPESSNTFEKEQLFTLYLIPQSFELGEVVIPASMEGASKPPNITKIDSLDFAVGQRLLIAPILNRIPGVYMHQGTFGTSRLTIRGIGARSLFSTTRVKAYLENIPLSTGDGETTIEDIDIPLLSELTIIRGPSSSLFGAGLGGVILMNSEQELAWRKQVTGDFQLASFNTLRANLSGSLATPDKAIGVHGSYLTSDGWRDNSNYTRYQASLHAKWKPSRSSELAFFGTFIDVKGFIPSSIDSATFLENPSSAAFTWERTQGNEDYSKGIMGINFTQNLGKLWKLRSSVPLNFRSNDELRPFNFLEEQAISFGNRTVVEGNTLLGKFPVQLYFGEEFFQEFYDWTTKENIGGVGEIGELISDNQESKRYINAFAQARLRIGERVSLSLGSNYNKTWYDYQDLFLGDSIDLSGNYEFDGILSPRFALWVDLGKWFDLNLQVSHGFSPPLLSETLTPDGQVNPDIQPETGWNYEIGISGAKFRKHTQIWEYGLTAYWLEANNLLVPRRVGNDQFVGVNAGRTRHLGLEFEGALTFFQVGSHTLKLWGNYTFMDHRFVDFRDEETNEVFDGNFLPGIPRHHGTMGINYNKINGGYPDLIFNLNNQLTSGMPLRDDNLDVSEAFGVWNGKVSFRGNFLNNHYVNRTYVISFGMNNILNTNYASMILVNAGSFGGNAPRYFYPGMPRSLFFEIKLYLDDLDAEDIYND
ncbi:MAG: TonB-dependent receptor [Bacteroidia bacterium]|nr:TonB-dependent receptor [Bacteroidia bacterium]